MVYVAAVIVMLVSVLGVAATLVTLPGVWVILATAVLCELWYPGMFSWWTLGVCAGLAVAGEIIELVASAVGASRAGGSRTGAAGAVVGTLIGAVAGTFVPVPILGTIAGAALGAGAGALVAERFIKKRGLEHSARIAAGAAAGRLVAVVVKTAICALVGVVVTAAAFLPGF